MEEARFLLRHCGLAELYPKDRRDAIIFYGIIHGDDLAQINDRLFANDEDNLI